MLGTMIVAGAMMAAGQRSLETRPTATAQSAPDDKARLIARRRAKKSAAYSGRLDREAREAKAEAVADAEAKKEFERTLPARLELNRQMLQRQTDIERNAILKQAVGAMERRAGYVYPGQSPSQGPF